MVNTELGNIVNSDVRAGEDARGGDVCEGEVC